MTKIDIFSGFLGAGKTTLIKKLIKEAYAGEKVVLIENEFGEIGIDGGFLQDAGINITEMNSGCICCSLVGDFAIALKQVTAQYAPDRIIIEPSGVGKLSDVITAVEKAELQDASLNAFCTVADAKKCKMYMKNFGEFFNDQIEHASCIVLSHTDGISEDKLATCVNLIKERNAKATVVTTSWDKLDGKDILNAMQQQNTLKGELEELAKAHALEHEHHHHHHHEDGEECCCHDHEHEHHHHHHHEDGEECHCHDHEHEHHHHHHHEDGEECCCRDHEHEHHHHHHHEDGEECHCHDHEHEHHLHHHHEDGEECCCHDHEHGHHHHHHHHADEVFTSWGLEIARKYSNEEISDILKELENEEKYGVILRAKGIVDGGDKWIYFDYVPEEADVRDGAPSITGRLCVIGCKINENAIKELFKA